ncbi:MAG: MFS transporter [Anaerolineae bacterium]|nr:MFS transporter [Anaerolineae bacterium]
MTGDRLSINAMVRASTIALTAGAALVWWNPSDLLGFLGLALMGLGFAPIFPLLQLVTPARVGLEHAANAIGFQSAAGYLGMGLMPGLAGMLAERWGLEVVGPFLLAGSLGMLVLYEIILRRGRQVVRSSRV